MTSNELISYSDQVVDFGKSMSKIQPNGSQFETTEYSGSQIYINSDRIVFNAEQDDIAFNNEKQRLTDIITRPDAITTPNININPVSSGVGGTPGNFFLKTPMGESGKGSGEGPMKGR